MVICVASMVNYNGRCKNVNTELVAPIGPKRWLKRDCTCNKDFRYPNLIKKNENGDRN